jgi:hypothetical protein
MTLLAHDLVMLRIPFDSRRLWAGVDPHYELWLQGLADRVAETNRRMNREKG